MQTLNTGLEEQVQTEMKGLLGRGRLNIGRQSQRMETLVRHGCPT